MKEIILLLTFLQFGNHPGSMFEVARYSSRQECLEVLKNHGITEKTKYLLMEESWISERKTPGRTIREPHYGYMRLGYYTCTPEQPWMHSELIRRP